MALGKRIEAERKARDWTQPYLSSRVAELSGDESTLTQQALDRLEKRDSATSEAAVYIAEALGVSLRWLLIGAGRKDDPDWPFRLVSRSKWDACDPEERGYVQSAMQKALAEIEDARSKPSPNFA